MDVEFGGESRPTTVTAIGPPCSQHFTELPWSAGLWDRLHEAIVPQLVGFWFTSEFAPHPGRLRVELEHEVAVRGVGASPEQTAAVPRALSSGSPTVAGGEQLDEGEEPDPEPARRKRSTERGDGHRKLIAALTKHHQYAQGGCLNLEPVGNNELAELAGVEKSTASAFFKTEFGGHSEYCGLCLRNVGDLLRVLKKQNGELSGRELLYGRRTASEE